MELVAENFDEITLAFWIMGDGYWSEGSIYLCTENFTKDEVNALIKLLHNQLGLVATIKKRGSGARIRFSRRSISKLRTLVHPHLHPSFYYRLGL